MCILNGKHKRPVVEDVKGKLTQIHASCANPVPESKCSLSPFVKRINATFADPNKTGESKNLNTLPTETLKTVISNLRSKEQATDLTDMEWFRSRQNQMAVYEELVGDEYDYPAVSDDRRIRLFTAWFGLLSPPKQKRGRGQNQEQKHRA